MVCLQRIHTPLDSVSMRAFVDHPERRRSIKQWVASLEQEIAILHVHNTVIASPQDRFHSRSVVTVGLEGIDVASSIQEDVISVISGVGKEVDALALAQVRCELVLGRD